MSTGVKKPPLAPKPKLPVSTKPPIAPKPCPLSQPSPSAPKRPKPAVAPKPCLPRSSGSSSPPVSPPSLKPTEPIGSALDENLFHLNSKNGILSETESRESDYIISTCSCSTGECHPQENGDANESAADFDKEPLQNGVTTGKNTEEEEETHEKAPADYESERISKKPRDKPQRQRHLDRGLVNRERTEEDSDVPTEAETAEQTAACDVAGNILTSIHPPESSQAKEQTFPISPLPDLPVPAAPSKPLPVPHPRKFKKPTLVRQDGVEGQDQATPVEEQKNEPELQQADDSETQRDSCLVDVETDVPVPPPRQTSLSPRLHRAVRCLLNKNTSHSLDLLSHPDSEGHGKEAQQDNEEEEDGYGDFERYPISHSLPKQIKLGCHRKALSAEDQQSPRAPPRKPQRHSLPAPPPPSVCPPAPPHASTPMRDLPPPPQEKTAWRFSRPSVTFFSRQIPTRSSVPPKSRALALGGKQRAQSFSAADLATRAGSSQKRSLSFRKLLELRLNVKMLPKLLAKGGQSLDCTSMDKSLGRPSSCIEDPDIHREDVEYENVPLYEEIPEYMNLPFHGARLGWPHDPDGGDANIYEVQDPFHRCSEHEYERWVQTTARALRLLDFRDAVAKATRQNGKPVVDERILSQILYYLPQLYQLNKDLLRELEDRVAHWSDHQRLSDIFVQKGPYLKMYSTYIRQFDNNVALLDEQCRKNPAFAAVVREFEMSPRCASLALKHYLLKPVQRIPQYQLLLTDYLKNLPEDSEDYKDTQTALSVVKEVANHANDIMKQGDNFQKLMQIQYSLNGQHEIVQPGRVFLKEGTLMKLSRKVMQPRMFFLFNDALMYTTPVQSAQYKLNSVLSLAGMKVSKPSQEAYQNELNIESVERSFILSASSAKERDEWLEAIGKAIEDYTKKKITFISSRSQEEAECVVDSGAPLGSKAPIWIPDLRATMCMICTCEFTLTWRRHHCRACGKVVCQACSTNKYYLEYLKNQPARVCDHCFAKLQENSDRCASSSTSPIKSGAFSFTRKQKKIPAALKEVSANTENSSMSGYLHRSKGNKKQWKRLWFVIKNKVLYTYAASEDVAALESQPLLGFFLREEKNGPAQKLQFKLYHKNTLFYIFKADDIPTAQRWIEAFQEAMILEQ
ncbi:FYVE, RhoGEF and PH domain-containing protein 6 [Poecilia reticulata]|uniref:FYVE, RhoGEF and PH domain-containing protein 6 n=1 Tax=Poecilia reticulata TaxID=8081 RepID=UPI0007EA4547|nr:PREDICTED: FYVE, RhoGEF and PH domain-containing protein 6-like [Poecilia reticulata]